MRQRPAECVRALALARAGGTHRARRVPGCGAGRWCQAVAPGRGASRTTYGVGMRCVHSQETIPAGARATSTRTAWPARRLPWPYATKPRRRTRVAAHHAACAPRPLMFLPCLARFYTLDHPDTSYSTTPADRPARMTRSALWSIHRHAAPSSAPSAAASPLHKTQLVVHRPSRLSHVPVSTHTVGLSASSPFIPTAESARLHILHLLPPPPLSPCFTRPALSPVLSGCGHKSHLPTQPSLVWTPTREPSPIPAITHTPGRLVRSPAHVQVSGHCTLVRPRMISDFGLALRAVESAQGENLSEQSVRVASHSRRRSRSGLPP